MNGRNKDIIIDLTKALDTSFIPYSRGTYSDPPLEISEWSTIRGDGFRVSRIALGSQSGTHIDAPAHFMEGGIVLDALPPDRFMGRFFPVNLTPAPSLSEISMSLAAYGGEDILFLRTPKNQSTRLPREAVMRILSLPADVLALSGHIVIEPSDPLEFHRMVARSAKFLVEDLDEEAAHRAAGHGEMFIFPLRVLGVSGAPCRVLVRMPGA
ncbi:MAG: hypothetical protein EG826_10725 [Deltaproteobacteria bacterium]|nr:hypothetical protein [Deltaproteobacteria bacterium]